MKRTNILILILGLVLSSCTKSDTPVTYQLTNTTLAGKWLITQVIKQDGTKVPYINLCSTTNDYVEFKPYLTMKFYRHYANCDVDNFTYSCDYVGLVGNKIQGCCDLVDGTVSVFTATDMQIDFGVSRNFLFGGNNLSPAIGIVLKRQ